MQDKQKIKVKAMCLLINNGRVLVAKGRDAVKNKNHYRVLGGSVNFFETSEEGVRREIREELDSELDNLEFVKVVENLFEYEGTKGHEVAFVYKGDLRKKELCNQKLIHIVEDTYEFDAEWVSIEELLEGNTPLYPTLNYRELLK